MDEAAVELKAQLSQINVEVAATCQELFGDVGKMCKEIREDLKATRDEVDALRKTCKEIREEFEATRKEMRAQVSQLNRDINDSRRRHRQSELETIRQRISATIRSQRVDLEGEAESLRLRLARMSSTESSNRVF